jgi:hypothetical protein
MSIREQIGGSRASHRAEFIDVVCADEELLKAEFDAIIEAAWAGTPPDDPPQHAVAAEESRPRHGTPWFPTTQPAAARPVAVQEGRSRQRSPPVRRALASGRPAHAT